MARVSITIPTYNRADLLGATIRGVLEQSFGDFELFVSDNASTDDTEGVVAGFADPRVTYLRSDENRGHFWNLSRGLHLGTAPYVAVLPDDDAWLPGNLEKKLAVLDSDPEIGIVHSGYKRLVRDRLGVAHEVDIFTDGISDATRSSAEMVRRLLAGRASIEYPTAVFRRSLLDPSDGFVPEDKGADDVALALRLAAKAVRVGYLADALVAILFHEDAGNRVAGGFERVGDDYVQTVRSVCDVRDGRLRFLARGAPVDDPDVLAREVRRRAQRELIGIARVHLTAREPVRDVARHTVAAVRADPGILLRREMAGFARSAAREGRSRVANRAERLRRWAQGRPPVGLVRFGNLRRVQPIESSWFARGTPVDRYYIGEFLTAHREDIRGRVLEVGDRNATNRYAAGPVESSDVLDVVATPLATIVADLSTPGLDVGTFDCVLCLQTAQMVFDIDEVFRNLRRLVAPGGTLLLSAHGLAQLDVGNPWDDTWRFLPVALRQLLEREFGAGNVDVRSYGNVLSAMALLHGISARELRTRELDVVDGRYPVLVAARAVVPGAED
jgi:glycosyltransferase involved in cell wall biosynthesis/SAM-dependent methyltransferase